MRRTTTALRQTNTNADLDSAQPVDRKRLPRLRCEGVVGVRVSATSSADEPELEPVRRSLLTARFIGDYSQIAMGTDGKAHASWTDFRGILVRRRRTRTSWSRTSTRRIDHSVRALAGPAPSSASRQAGRGSAGSRGRALRRPDLLERQAEHSASAVARRRPDLVHRHGPVELARRSS